MAVEVYRVMFVNQVAVNVIYSCLDIEMFKTLSVHFIDWWLCRSHSATQPLCQSGWCSHSATLPEWLEQPLSHSARVADAATQPLCQSGWSSHSATLPAARVAGAATQPLCQSRWRSHSATLPEWLEQPLSHSATLPAARVAHSATLPEWLTQPLSYSARVAGAATQTLSHSARVAGAATQPLCQSGWCENFRHCAFNLTLLSAGSLPLALCGLYLYDLVCFTIVKLPPPMLLVSYIYLTLLRFPWSGNLICCRQGQPFCCLRWSDSEITDVWLPFSARNFVWILHGLTRDNRFNRYSNKHDGLPLTLWGPLLKSASPEQDPLPCRHLPSQNDRRNMNPSKNLLPQNLSGFQDGLNLVQATTSPKLSTRIETTWPCHAMAHSHGWCHMVLLMLHVSSWWKSSFVLGGLWWAAFRLHGYILHDFRWFPKSAIKMVDNLRMHKPSNRLSRQQTPNNVKEDACRKSNDKNLYKIYKASEGTRLRKYRARSSWAAWAWARPRNKNLLRLQPTRSYKSLHRSSSAYSQDSHGRTQRNPPGSGPSKISLP